MDYLYLLREALVWIITIFWLYQIMVSLCSLVKIKDKPLKVNKNHRFMAIIPAHNEEAVIGNLIESLKNQNYDKYSTYLYDRASNMFYEIDSPKFPIFQGVGIVKLTNGDILFVGGTRDMKSNNKIQKYIYK